jgi:hypothetical protein
LLSRRGSPDSAPERLAANAGGNPGPELEAEDQIEEREEPLIKRAWDLIKGYNIKWVNFKYRHLCCTIT